MIFLLLDVLISYFALKPTFFVLLNFLVYPRSQYFSFILIPLVMDLLILNTFFLNTLIFTILFFLSKHFVVVSKSIGYYILHITIIYILYICLIGLIKGYTLIYLFKFILTNYIYNLIFYLLCYKILKPFIKLAR